MKYHDKTIKHNIFHNDGWAKTKETSFITATIFTPAHRRIRGFTWINFLIQWKSTGCRSLLTAAKELWMKFTILFLLKPTKQCLNNKRPVCIMSCNSLMMSRVPAATSRACTLSAYVGGGYSEQPWLLHIYLLLRDAYCSNSLLVCWHRGRPCFTSWLKNSSWELREERQRENGRERKRGKHFRKEWHGTQTRPSLKPADNPADWFGHIRDQASIWQSGSCKCRIKRGLTALLGQWLPANFAN